MQSNRNELKYIAVDDLVPSLFNAQHQNEKTFNMLVDDILDNGVITALTVVPITDSKYQILAGEHRWRAARVAGEEELPCLVLVDAKFSQEEMKQLLTVRLNSLQGKLNPEKFFKIYNPLVQKHGKDTMQRLLGFADDKILKSLKKQVSAGMKKILPKEMHQDLEKATAEVTAVEDLNLIVQNMFQQYGKTVNQGFMVFTHGSQEHVYINMNKKIKKSMDKALSYCRTTGTNINDFLAPLFAERIEQAICKLGENESKNEEIEEVPF